MPKKRRRAFCSRAVEPSSRATTAGAFPTRNGAGLRRNRNGTPGSTETRAPRRTSTGRPRLAAGWCRRRDRPRSPRPPTCSRHQPSKVLPSARGSPRPVLWRRAAQSSPSSPAVKQGRAPKLSCAHRTPARHFHHPLRRIALHRSAGRAALRRPADGPAFRYNVRPGFHQRHARPRFQPKRSVLLPARRRAGLGPQLSRLRPRHGPWHPRPRRRQSLLEAFAPRQAGHDSHARGGARERHLLDHPRGRQPSNRPGGRLRRDARVQFPGQVRAFTRSR
jgi:hypothetical protein